MRRISNQKRETTIQMTSQDFPELSVSQNLRETTTESKADWLSAISAYKYSNIRTFANGDSFEGEYDIHGNPIRGKLMFANGNTYYGPINTSWKIQKEDTDGHESEECYSQTQSHDQENSTDYDNNQYTDYGEMVYADGSSFWGIFCFKDNVWI